MQNLSIHTCSYVPVLSSQFLQAPSRSQLWFCPERTASASHVTLPAFLRGREAALHTPWRVGTVSTPSPPSMAGFRAFMSGRPSGPLGPWPLRGAVTSPRMQGLPVPLKRLCPQKPSSRSTSCPPDMARPTQARLSSTEMPLSVLPACSNDAHSVRSTHMLLHRTNSLSRGVCILRSGPDLSLIMIRAAHTSAPSQVTVEASPHLGHAASSHRAALRLQQVRPNHLDGGTGNAHHGCGVSPCSRPSQEEEVLRRRRGQRSDCASSEQMGASQPSPAPLESPQTRSWLLPPAGRWEPGS